MSNNYHDDIKFDIYDLYKTISNPSDRDYLSDLAINLQTPFQVARKEDRAVKLGFRRHNEQYPFIARLTPAELIVQEILKNSQKNDVSFEDDLFFTFLKGWDKYMGFINIKAKKRDRIIFQLKENYTSLYDISYYEVCFKFTCPKTGEYDCVVRLHLDEVPTECDLSLNSTICENMDNFTNSNIIMLSEFKLLINVSYNNIKSIWIPLLHHFKESLSIRMYSSVDVIDEDIISLIDMLDV